MEKYPKKRAYVRGKLKKFLDEKGATKQFIANCKKVNSKRNLKEMRSAFWWAETEEGMDFWAMLDDEFEGLND